MKRIFVAGALLVAIGLVGVAPAQAAPLLFGTLNVNAQTFNLTLTPDPSKPTRFFFDDVFRGADFDISANGTLDPDPQILFALNVQNFGTAPLTIALGLGAPFPTIPIATTVTSSIRGSLQPGTGAPTGVTVTPTIADLDGDGTLELMVVSTSDPFANSRIDVGPSATFATPGVNAYGPFNATAIR